MPLEARVDVDVPFQDCDPMGVTWHGNYFRYLESARAVLLANIGYDYREMMASGYLWPIVEAQIKYLKPTVFGQRLTVTARLEEYENRLRIAYTIVDHDSGEMRDKSAHDAGGRGEGERRDVLLLAAGLHRQGSRVRRRSREQRAAGDVTLYLHDMGVVSALGTGKAEVLRGSSPAIRRAWCRTARS